MEPISISLLILITALASIWSMRLCEIYDDDKMIEMKVFEDKTVKDEDLQDFSSQTSIVK